MPAYQYLDSLEAKVDPRNAALLVIDVQNDFVSEGGFADSVGWPVEDNQLAVANLKALLEAARRATVPVIFVKSNYDDIFLSLPMRERNQRRDLEMPRCIRGTWGEQFYQVQPASEEAVVTKHRYSAFVDTELNTVLRARNVQTLILTGVYTEVCVESTARDGYFQDYYVVIVSDCCATTSEGAHSGALARCERDFGVVATGAEIMRLWANES